MKKAVALRPSSPSPWREADVAALQALYRGDATPFQQKHALEYIINTVAATYDLSYRADSPRDTDFAEGKRFVGLQIVKLLKLNLLALKETP